MPTIVIGTAGHIDHGKTALLRALTGIDADRLPEERARGMTIDVGYAHLTFDDGVELDFVDVPGHDRLIGNMLVGASEIDAAMLVVAADDGPRPQTIEHLQLLDALGIDRGIAVVTKVDLVDASRAAAVVDEVRSLLHPTCLRGAEVLQASSVVGIGIDALRETLRRIRDQAAEAGAGSAGALGTPWRRGPARLAVDRVFTSKGRGVVVTGSLRGGSIRAGDSLRREPGGELVRVRELQVHGATRNEHDGGRTALNLAGLGADDLRRGDVLMKGVGISATDRLLVRSAWRAGEGRPPNPGARLRLHIGTDQAEARVRRVADLDRDVLLDLDRPVATFAGDRAVLREPGRGEIVGGVMVLELAPPHGVSRRRVTRERVDALATAIERGDDAAIHGARVDLHGVLASGDAAGQPASVELAPDVRDALQRAAVEAVAAHLRAVPVSAGLPLTRARSALLRRLRAVASVDRRVTDAAAASVSGLLDEMVRAGRLAREGEALRDPALASGTPSSLLEAMSRLEAALSVGAPPSLDVAALAAGCPPEGVRALQASGRIVRIAADLAWAAPTYHQLAGRALEMARAAPLSPAAFRDATGTSRKYVLAIMEDLDRRGVLQRTPEGHIPGPRAPQREPPAAVETA